MKTKASVIRDESTYNNYVDRIHEIIDAKEGSPEHDELLFLSLLVQEYENRVVEIEKSDPLDVIQYIMEERGLKQADLVGILGDKASVSKILHRKRHLTLEMIRRFSKEFNVPADLLIQEYELA